MSDRLRIVCKGFRDAVSAAVRNNDRRGQGGQQVSFHGDFCNANPSTLSRLTWWAREMELAMNEEPDALDDRAHLRDALGSALALTYVPTHAQDDEWHAERERLNQILGGEKP